MGVATPQDQCSSWRRDANGTGGEVPGLGTGRLTSTLEAGQAAEGVCLAIAGL